MNSTDYLYLGAGLAVLVVLAAVAYRRIPRRLDTTRCMSDWRTLQKHCANKKSWHLAVVDADHLLDDVLKRRHYKGKSTGERLVSAQRHLSSNDTVWFGHKLRNRIVQDDLKKISKQDTLEALAGFRQALKDLGALVEAHQEVADE